MSSPNGITSELAARTELRRQSAAGKLDAGRRVELGQFFTPEPAARFIASLPKLKARGKLRVLDPGAGAGSLSGAIVARSIDECRKLEVDLTAVEVDERLHLTLGSTLADCEATAAAVASTVRTTLLAADFIEWAADDPTARFDLVIMNPPYRKLNRATRERALVEKLGVDVSNLYAAFLTVAVNLLDEGGQLVAITPRSFTNGPYFRKFRRFFLDRMDLDHIHVFTSRTSVFADSEVLQENVIFSATRRASPQRGPVTISSSDGYADVPNSRSVEYGEVIHPRDPECFWHISTDEQEAELAKLLAALPAALSDLDLQVSTGRVVDFRATQHLRPMPEPGSVPLIYPFHMREGRILWPVPSAKKCNAIMLNDETARQTFPLGYYPVVKRMSSKEEKRRVVASLFDPNEVPCEAIGFENHVNVFHRNGAGLPEALARGLCLWLNSSVLDRLVRRFNGHTQINATDLRNLRYPSASELEALGYAWGGGSWPDQAKIDSLVEEHVVAVAARLGDRGETGDVEH